MTKTPIGFYKKDGKTRPISAASGKRKGRSPRSTKFKPRDPNRCNECGRSVRPGSGDFVNRIPDCNSVSERKSMGKPYPYDDFICAVCDDKFSREVE